MNDGLERHKRLRAVFDEALLRDPSTREDYLDQACADDPALRPEVTRLLTAHSDAEFFLEHPVVLTPPSAPTEGEFTGNDRFAVLRRLGAGGMGVVYEAHDRARGEIVALKTLLRATAADVYRLKREFRSLADVSHPNLVCLYELVVEGQCGFFTMELVKGVSFVEYVRQGSRRTLSLDRLLPALRQLVEGVMELHRMGKLHRDIKPSNVLVTMDGRVVILDFGLIAELLPHNPGSGEHIAGGTPAYASPEQGSGAQPSEAADWYGVGATLYEALTGQVPFKGTPLEVLLLKKNFDPPSPTDVVSDVPQDLSALCAGLIARDPARRLSGRDVLIRLGASSTAPVTRRAGLTSAEAPFVGRKRELAILDEAFRTVTERRPAAVYVCGASGIGKSALVRSFLAPLRTRKDVVVLSGRCYERESVPYKALDGVVDSLSRFMASLPASQARSLLPNDVVALPRLFPVMLQVPAIAEACRDREPTIAEPFLLRRLAFEVLRRLLVRIADHRQLIVFIDDLQWADSDGVLLLEELLRPPDAPALLTIVSFRSEEVAGKPFLRKLLEDDNRNTWLPLPLDPMPEAEAGELVEALLPADSPLSDDQRLRITREAGGSPFVLEQLARYAGVTRMEPNRGPTFAEMFDTRLAALTAEARRFLETLATCGRPVAPELICEACGVDRERQSLVAMLRSSQLIRSSGSSERVETYHDRIRDVLVRQIAPDATRRIHHRMVQALIDGQSDDCEALFEHYRGAGDAENASIQAGVAAAKAGSALAFDRAASFYRHALALAPAAPGVQAWKEGLAHALANASRPEEAAESYLRAAAGASHFQQVELRRRGAEQFLTGGHIDRGLDLIRAELEGLGLGVPGSPRLALFWLLWHRARLRWRGLDFMSRPASDIDAKALLRIDLCWSAATGLALVDIISASDFIARSLLMALDAGEPSRIARAMVLESAARGGAYPRGSKFRQKLTQQSKALAESVGNPHATALSTLADALVASSTGQWKRALTLSEQALAILRDQCVGVTWELNIAQNLVLWALMYLGELRAVSRLVPALLADARSRGNLYLATELCTRSNYAWLAADEPDEGERVTIESIEGWSHKGCHRQHYSAMLARMQTALYRGNADAAWGLVRELELIVRQTCLTHVQVMRIESFYLRARSALAMAARHGSSRQFLSVARADARRIARERMPWSDPIALLLRAGIANLEGDTPLALKYLHDAASQFARADMSLYVGVTLRRIGALQPDEQGRELRRQSDAWMAEQNIKNPAAMTRMLSPGFPDAI